MLKNYVHIVIATPLGDRVMHLDVDDLSLTDLARLRGISLGNSVAAVDKLIYDSISNTIVSKGVIGNSRDKYLKKMRKLERKMRKVF